MMGLDFLKLLGSGSQSGSCGQPPMASIDNSNYRPPEGGQGAMPQMPMVPDQIPSGPPPQMTPQTPQTPQMPQMPQMPMVPDQIPSGPPPQMMPQMPPQMWNRQGPMPPSQNFRGYTPNQQPQRQQMPMGQLLGLLGMLGNR